MGRLRIEFVVRRASQKGEKSQIMETMKIGVSPYAQSDPEGARRGSQSTGVVEDETAGQIAGPKQASMQVRKVKEVPGVDQEIALSESDPVGARRGSQSTGVVEDETVGQIAVLKQASMQERKEDDVTGVGREIALRGGMYPDQGGKKGEVGGEIDPHAEDPSTGVIGNGESAPRAGGQS